MTTLRRVLQLSKQELDSQDEGFIEGKRKRGKKKFTLKITKTEENSSSDPDEKQIETNQNMTNLSGVTDETKSKPKKKRGRPRKNPLGISTLSFNSSETNSNIHSMPIESLSSFEDGEDNLQAPSETIENRNSSVTDEEGEDESDVTETAEADEASDVDKSENDENGSPETGESDHDEAESQKNEPTKMTTRSATRGPVHLKSQTSISTADTFSETAPLPVKPKTSNRQMIKNRQSSVASAKGRSKPLLPEPTPNPSLGNFPLALNNNVVDVNWVQCDACKIWYELPLFIDQKTLPDHWFCEMITWNVFDNKSLCLVRQQQAQQQNAFPSTGPSTSTSDKPAILGSAPAELISPKGFYSLKDIIEGQDQWVECDKCKKWRKIPSFVKTDKLPAKWFCYLNVYDPAHNSCAVPQEKYSNNKFDYVYNNKMHNQQAQIDCVESTVENDRKRKLKHKKNSVVGIPNTGPNDPSYNTNKMIKAKFRHKEEHPCVYGVEEKRLKKNKRNPCTFKELVWWHHNDFHSEHFEKAQMAQIAEHFEGSSLVVQPAPTLQEETCTSPNSRQRRYSRNTIAPDICETGHSKFYQLFLSEQSGIGVIAATAAKSQRTEFTTYNEANYLGFKSKFLKTHSTAAA